MASRPTISILNLPSLNTLGVRQPEIYGREQFRHRSYISPVARGVICGLGRHGYLCALDALSRIVGGEA